jgi:hypothetical protein
VTFNRCLQIADDDAENYSARRHFGNETAGQELSQISLLRVRLICAPDFFVRSVTLTSMMFMIPMRISRPTR